MSAARSTVLVLLALVPLAVVLLTPPPAAVLAQSPSTDATRGGLTLSEGRLDPVFATGSTDYAAGVGYTVTRITVVPTTTDANATAAYLDRQVRPETSYVYRVRARNAAGLSRQSQHLNADSPAAPAQRDPRAARNLTAELVTGGGITLRWEAPAEDAESVSGYEILRRRPFRGEQTLLSYVADTGSAATSYTDVDADEPGQAYVYRVVALRGAEHSGRSNRARLVAPQPDPADLAPSNLSARVDEQGIALGWAAPPADAGAVTGYRLLRAVGDSAMSILVADTGPDATAYFDSSAVAPGATYRYQVLAVRGEQASQGSITAVVSVPESLVARAGESANAAATAPGNLTATLRDDHIRLRWTTPQEDGSSVTGYQILRSHAGSTWSVLTANTYSAATTYEDSATTQPGVYVYQVKAWRGGELSGGSSNQTYAIQPGSCVGDQFNSNPVDVPVSATPIVVESTPADYFVLFVRPSLNQAAEIPISVTLGAAGTTTLTEQLPALPVAHYRVEKYPVEDPADMDGDCISDIVELADPGTLNPLNRAPEIEFRHGNVAIPDRETFEGLSYQGVIVQNDLHLRDLEFVKFFLLYMSTSRPAVYFMNTVTHRTHQRFQDAIRTTAQLSQSMKGEIVYHPNVVATDGSLGVYRFEFQRDESYPFNTVQHAYEVLAASMPLLENNLAYYPMPPNALPRYHREQAQYDGSRVDVLLEADIFPDIDFISLNQGTGYGILRVMEREERPNPREIVIYESLPNDLPRVAGIITTVPQTPLSHVNLRAMQDRIPNAFVRDAVDDETIDSLIDSHVQYTVTPTGYTIRAATKAEVDTHYDESRPTATQTPARDLTVTGITALSDVGFDDWTAFGVKAANVAVLGTLGLPDGTVPDGYAVPFYFYDEFMKANDLYTMVSTMLAGADFQADYDEQDEELKKLRAAIKDGTTPDWIITALEEMHAEFPDGTSLRYRSSTNNEDLPGFSGAGLYDSKTQDPDETEEDGVDKSIKGVWASLWNFRAFVERDFYRIDHNATAMGVLVHPNYSDELANGVAVSHDPISDREGAYYVNTQVGEDLVTNPEALSVPEELLLLSDGGYEVLVRSNQVESEQLLMSDAQLGQLRRHLTTIHDSFKDHYDPAEDGRFAMEIEFKITSDDVLAIKQARPWVSRSINEPPAFPATETGVRTIAEGTGMDTDIGSPVAATDTEGDTVTYSLGGSRANQFRIDASSGQLRTSKHLDYEQVNTYEVVVTASDLSNPQGATIPVRIILTNEEEPGALTLSSTAPQVGTQLTATLTDPDGGITGQSWSWQRSLNGSSWTPIANAGGGRYIPVDTDLNHYLRVTVQYTDGHGAGKQLQEVSNDRTATSAINNRPPAFDSSAMERSVLENSTAGTRVGTAVVADDPDGDELSYRLSGDAGFVIDNATGQIRVAHGAVLDYETRLTYTVQVTAADFNASATTVVTVTVTDVNEPPVFADDSVELEVAEDAEEGDKVRAPVTATDDDGDRLTYRFVGNGLPFDIEEASGQIVVASGASFDRTIQDAYTVTVEARDPDFASAHTQVTINVVDQPTHPLNTGGGGGGVGPSGPTPSTVDFEWNVKRDIEELAAHHDGATGMWSDGQILWLGQNGDGAGDAIYAYDLESGERVEEREFELDETNRAPRGVASDGVTMWIADSGRDTLFAHDLASGERLTEQDFMLHHDNADPRGIWSDGETLWVLDGGDDALFAYAFASGELLAEYALDSANDDAHGLYFDGVTFWVSDHGAKRLFAYRLAAGEAGEDELERNRDEEFTNAVLSRASNNSPRGIWSDGDVMYVVDESDGRVYSYNMPDAIDARLASLSLSGVEFGEFLSRRTEYEGVADGGVTETTVEAVAVQSGAEVAIDPPDADEATDGHQLVLGGVEAITVTVTSADGSRTKDYLVRFGDAAEAEQPVVACLRGAVGIGFSLVVYEGGSVDDLGACAQSRSVTALYVPHEGEYVSYILGAPDFVNEEFVALYRDGLPALAPLIAKSAGPPSPAPPSDDVPEFGPECLRGAIATGFSLVLYGGGSVEALDTCAQGRDISAVYALVDGEWMSYILGAPEFVNREFRELFTDGLPAVMPLVAKSEGPPLAH